MILLCYFCVGIFLIIVQTTLLPHMDYFGHMYDFLVPVIIHASVFRPLGECLCLVFVFGVVMDNLSGTPAGFYLTFYVWILVAVRYLKLILHVGSIALVTLVVLAAVALESLTLIGIMTVNQVMIAESVNALRFALLEVFWAILTAPLLLALIDFLLKMLPAVRKALTTSGQDEIKGR